MFDARQRLLLCVQFAHGDIHPVIQQNSVGLFQPAVEHDALFRMLFDPLRPAGRKIDAVHRHQPSIRNLPPAEKYDLLQLLFAQKRPDRVRCRPPFALEQAVLLVFSYAAQNAADPRVFLIIGNDGALSLFPLDQIFFHQAVQRLAHGIPADAKHFAKLHLRRNFLAVGVGPIQYFLPELLLDLNATDEQFESPTLFCSGRQGTASYSPDVPGTDLKPLFDTILQYVKCPEGDPEAPFQMLCSSVDYNDFVGRIGIGRIQNGVARVGQDVQVCDWHNPDVSLRGRITKLYDFKANGREPIEEAKAGDIVAFSGLADVTIGNTLCDPANVEPLPFVKINDPTVEMTFSVNDSPFAGREGKYVTSRQIRDRLQRELLKDVALRVEDSATSDSFRVMGRGEMHLSILIETMRREGYELQVSPPKVLTHVENGKTMEPMERVVVDVPTDYQGAVMTALGSRKAILQQMEPIGSRVRLEFRMPSRGLFGYRSQFLTDTHGEGILNTIFDGYEEWQGDITCRSTGSLISFETGDAVTYGLFNAQGRGTLIVTPGEKVYGGMVVGYTPTGEDITVNVCKTKHLTNTRASGSDDALRLVPVSKFSLEGCLEFLAPDELLEVTPKSLRIRKRILSHDLRMKELKGKKN